MLDILDSARKSAAIASQPKLNIENSKYVNQAIAVYKRTSGHVSHVEQSLLDHDYVNQVQPVSNVVELRTNRIGTLINIYVWTKTVIKCL